MIEDGLPPINPDDVRVFSGRSNRKLARGIAAYLDVPLAPAHFSRFTNDNLFVQLGASVRGRIVYIVQSLTRPVSDHLVGLLMMLDIAKSAAAREVHAIIPYYSYARSDKKDAPRISITARLVADLLQTAGTTHVMTMTLHSPQTHGFFSVPADPLTARGLFTGHFREQGFSAADSVVVAPDVGAARSATRLADSLGLEVATASKTRLADDQVRITGLVGRQVKGFRRAIVFDDEVATGGTMVELCGLLVDSGVEEITIACTHGLFLGKAPERLNAIPQIREIVTTDTVRRAKKYRPRHLTVLPTAPVFGSAILANYHRRSIGELFAFWQEGLQL